SLAQLIQQWAHLLETLVSSDRFDGPKLPPQCPKVETTPDVLELWDAATRAHPSTVALISGERQLTYRELYDGVERTARALRRHLERPLTGCAHLVVALELARSVDAITLLLATLRVGACYAFIDPDQPLRRRRDLIRRLE